MSPSREPIIFAAGQPLLDIIAHVEDKFLEQYKLKKNQMILVEQSQCKLSPEWLTSNNNVKYIAGGSFLNTLRVIQWLNDFKTGRVRGIGCIGSDIFGPKMAEEARKAQVDVRFCVDQSIRTGYCCVLITDGGKNRTLVTSLGASRLLNVQHIEANMSLIVDCEYLYITGFLIATSVPVIIHLGQYAADNDRYFCYNLSSAFITEKFSEQLFNVIPYVDVLFGNTDELNAYGKMKHPNLNLKQKDILRLLVNEAKINRKRQRLIIITDGKNPVLWIKSGADEFIHSLNVEPLSDELIVDSNAAGDAFVGGFLSRFITHQPIEMCVKVGIYAAQAIIKEDGCTLPKYKPDLTGIE